MPAEDEMTELPHSELKQLMKTLLDSIKGIEYPALPFRLQVCNISNKPTSGSPKKRAHESDLVQSFMVFNDYGSE